MKSTLIVGASGATGKQLVNQLLELDQKVKVIVRPSAIIPESWSNNDKVVIIKANVSEVSENEMREYLKDCSAIASCLGHNMTWKGIYGEPRLLVTNTLQLICNSIRNIAPEHPVKILLMNTAGNRNRDLTESIPMGQKFIIALIRIFLPPHVDNEKAADFLRTEIGQQNKDLKWCAIRPDSLIDQEKVTDYQVYTSPIRSALFNPGKTSRINVGNFMAKLITDDEVWNSWKGKMPVIYNKDI